MSSSLKNMKIIVLKGKKADGTVKVLPGTVQADEQFCQYCSDASTVPCRTVQTVGA